MLQLSTVEFGTLELLKKLQASPMLGNFENAEKDIMPEMLVEKSWDQVKNEILSKEHYSARFDISPNWGND